MSILDIFVAKSQQLSWERLRPGHAVDANNNEIPGMNDVPIDKDQAYFVIRMKEMYLKYSRKLWRKQYPVLHSYTEHMSVREHAMAGPGELKDLGDANLNRIVNLNYRLAGLTPFRGDDVSLVAGLYAVPMGSAVKTLISTVAGIANLGGFALGQADAIANAVHDGVEGILNLDKTTLQLGIRDTFSPGGGNELRTGYHIGISAPHGSIPMDQLWLKDGRLLKGKDPIQGTPMQDFDYMVLAVEKRDSRSDWPGLPEIAEYNEKFQDILSNDALDVAGKKAKLGELWGHFTGVLDLSPNLTDPDRDAIANDVAENLRKRIDAIDGGQQLFETKSWGSDDDEELSVDQFDFVDIPMAPNRFVAAARTSASPFAMG